MKDFKNKKLYDDEIGKFETFINERLETKSEYNKYDTGKEEEEIEDFGAVQTLGFGGMDDPFGDLTSGDNSFGGFGDAFSDTFSQGSMSNKKNFNTFENDSSFSLFLKSPIYLSDYVFKDLIYKENAGEGEVQKFNLRLEHAKDFFKYIGYSGLFLASTSLMSLMLGTNSLHTPILGLSVGFASILGGEYFNWKYFNQGIIAKYYPNENPSANNPIEDIENPEMGEEGAFDFNEGVSNFSFDDFDTESTPTISLFDDEDEEEDFEDEEINDSDYGVTILPDSSIETKDEYEFRQGLVKAFMRNEKYKGRYLDTRKEVMDSFSNIILNNDKSFTKWVVERERTALFNNISYTIFKALSSINRSFAKDDTAKLTIMSIKYSPLLYKIEAKLPQKYFDEKKMKKEVKVFETFLKRDASDSEVLCMISVSGDTFVFRFLKLDYKGYISLGDILRYQDDGANGTAYQQMLNPKLGTPMLVGLRDNEYPHVIDLEANTAMGIVGGSGSGKSWFTYLLGTNIVTSNDYNEVNFIVLDLKNSTFWQTFARMPHVIGYHSPDMNLGISDEDFLNNCIKVSSEVVQECYRRQAYLNDLEMEDAKELRNHFKSTKQYEELKKFPLLVFCIDEITSTMLALETMDKKKEAWDAFRKNLSIISQVGRSAGVRLLTIGQRSVDASLPKNVRANTSILFGMKLSASSDFNILFDEAPEVKDMPKPADKGIGILTSSDYQGYHNIKTLTPGGASESQIRTFLRVVAFDWLRRSSGRDDLYQLPYDANFKVGFNRPRFLDLSFAEIREGKLLSKLDVNPEVAMDLTGKNPVINRNTTIMDKVIEKPKAKEEIVEAPIIGGISLDDFVTSNAEDFLEDDSSLDYDDSLPISHSPEPQPYAFNDSDEDDLLEDEDEDMGESLIAQETIPLLDEYSELDNYLPDDFDFDVAFDENFSLDSEQQSVVEKEDEEKIAERERIRLEIEKERLAEERLRMQQEVEAERLELQRLKENQEREQERFRLEKERLEQERLQQERLQQERYRLEKERIEKERLEQERKLMEERKSLTENVQKPKETFTSNENPRVVNLAYHSQANTQASNVDKVDIREFIFTNGSKLSDFEYAVSTEMLKSNYTKAEIARAIKIGDIYEAKDGYVSII